MYGGIGIAKSTALGALTAMGITKPGDTEYNDKLVTNRSQMQESGLSADCLI